MLSEENHVLKLSHGFGVLLPFVENLKAAYAGQKFITLVAINTNAKIPNIVIHIPVMTLVKYKTTTTSATRTLIARSVKLKFFLIANNSYKPTPSMLYIQLQMLQIFQNL